MKQLQSKHVFVMRFLLRAPRIAQPFGKAVEGKELAAEHRSDALRMAYPAGQSGGSLWKHGTHMCDGCAPRWLMWIRGRCMFVSF